jgi:hypothetical protein
MNTHEQLQQLLADSGVSKIVYALVMPETEQAIDAVLDGVQSGGRESYHRLFREAWTQKQDAVHGDFFATWLDWTQSILQWPTAEFPFRYPTAGASEGLREAIHRYGARARLDGFEPTIHLFEGEYEGFAAYARAAGIRTAIHRRGDWRQAIEIFRPRDQIYISQPSAIDGCVWSDFDRFVESLYRHCPDAEVMLDLSYVGCVPKAFTVRADHPNISVVFFSLSKPAGMYYHRIGGMFAREEYLGLFGNKWFKNISSLAIGTEFMRRHSVFELPRKYEVTQQRVIDEIREQLGLALRRADIMLLAIGPPGDPISDLERFLLRGPEGDALVRVCLTARMAHRIDPKLNPQVSARYYEQL